MRLNSKTLILGRKGKSPKCGMGFIYIKVKSYIYGNTIKKNELTHIKFRVSVTSGGERKGNTFGKLQMYLMSVLGTQEFILLLYVK